MVSRLKYLQYDLIGSIGERFRNISLRAFFVIPFFTVISCSCEGPQAVKSPEDMISGSLFIIGGGSRPEALVQRMIDESGLLNGGYAVVLPMASGSPDSAIVLSSQQFIELGMTNITGFNFIANKPVNQNWIDSLKNASLIYISGGDQNVFMSIAGSGPIEDAINHAFYSGAMIAGTSAGAAVMSEKMITGNELRYPDYSATFRTIESNNLELGRGLGFLKGSIIDQHFVWRSRHNRLFTAVIENPGIMGIGIDESTAVLVRGNKAEVVGNSQVMVFTNPGNSRNELNEKLGARGLKVDIFLPGEIFDIK